MLPKEPLPTNPMTHHERRVSIVRICTQEFECMLTKEQPIYSCSPLPTNKKDQSWRQVSFGFEIDQFGIKIDIEYYTLNGGRVII